MYHHVVMLLCYNSITNSPVLHILDGETFDKVAGELSPELLNLNLSDIYANGSHQAEDFIKA